LLTEKWSFKYRRQQCRHVLKATGTRVWRKKGRDWMSSTCWKLNCLVWTGRVGFFFCVSVLWNKAG